MAQSVKLADDVMAPVRHEAEIHCRSVAGQITHWIKIGRAIEYSDAYNHARVTAALEGRIETSQLTEEEETVWLDAFTEKMGQPSETEETFYASRQVLGQGVGLDAGGNLIYAKDDTAT
jgi:ParD-like antitoxin of type II bacterial toxin-antitoxin system